MTTVVYQATDHSAATRWYTELLGVEPYLDRGPYVEFRIGDYQHELGILDAAYVGSLGGEHQAPDPASAAGLILYWHVEDIPAALERLEAMGATLHQPARDFGTGFVGASVVDPFGNVLGVMDNPHYREVRTSLGVG